MKSEINTKYGTISFLDSESPGKCIIFLHGISCCKEVFFDQFEKLKAQYRVIIPDLLGHGESDNALNPSEAYTIPGLATSIIELLTQLKLTDVYIFGWSLGGSISIELLERFSGIEKVILHGYPPVSYLSPNFHEAYRRTEYTHLISQKIWSEQDAINFMNFGGLKPKTDAQKEHSELILNMIKRSDGQMREILYNSILSLIGINPLECVLKHKNKIKIVLGERDSGINPEYFDAHFPKLTAKIPHSGHASFWDQPYVINNFILKYFNK